jgi:hypothetical protein
MIAATAAAGLPHALDKALPRPPRRGQIKARIIYERVRPMQMQLLHLRRDASSSSTHLD